MALPEMVFDPVDGFRNTVTYADPVDTAAARNQVQTGLDQLRDFINDDFKPALASTANGEGASQIGIEDSGGKFTATNVEAALAELAGYTTETAHEVFSTTRNISTAGVQTISGLPFAAKKIKITANINGTAHFSEGVAVGTGAQRVIYHDSSGTTGFDGTKVIHFLQSATWDTSAAITAITASSIELTWSIAAGTPSGTANLVIELEKH